MSINLNNLGISDEQFSAPVDLDNLPEQIGGFEVLQPGKHVFTMPASAGDGVWPNGLFEIREDGVKGKQLVVHFGFNKDTKFDGRLTTKDGKKVSWIARSRWSKIDGKPTSLDYLIADGLGYGGKVAALLAMANAINEHLGKSFVATSSLSGYNKNNQKAFSSRPYTNKKTGKETYAIPRDPDGKFPNSFEDDGSTVYCNVELQSFAAAE